MKTKSLRLLASTLVIAMVVMLMPMYKAEAAVSAISLSGGGFTGSSIDASTGFGAATLNFTTAAALTVDGNTIKITLNGAVVTAGQTLTVADLTLTGETLEASPGVSDDGVHEVTITNGASGNTDPEILITLDSSGGTPPNFTAAAHTLVFLTGQLESSATPGNYSEVFITTSELGIGMMYVADDNDVLITATVAPNLSLIIRNTADSADTNVCDLGELSSASVSTCDYRVAVGTNASGGLQVQITSDGDLDTAGADTIDVVVEDSTVTAGSEEYGIAITGATAGGETGGAFTNPIVEDGDFNDDDTPIPTSATNFLSYGSAFQYTALTLTTSTLVTHRASIDSATMAGSYDQVVTYTITATF